MNAISRHLDAYFKLNPGNRGKGVSEIEIIDTFNRNNIPLSEQYKLFIQQYGSARIGPFPIFGLTPCEGILRWWKQITEAPPPSEWWSVVRINGHKKYSENIKDKDWIIFSLDHSGFPICITSQGDVWISVPDIPRETRKIADDFESFILSFCLQKG